MDRLLIKSLIDALEASGLSELEFSRDGATLRLVKGAASSAAPAAPRPAAVAAPPAAPAPPAEGGILAPLYGIVHLQRAPGAPPFVTPGQTLAAGEVVCMIEAMKVFTDIRAESAGTVAEILVANGQEVEAGQALVRLA